MWQPSAVYDPTDALGFGPLSFQQSNVMAVKRRLLIIIYYGEDYGRSVGIIAVSRLEHDRASQQT
jgi:hypothetical protein